MGQILSSEKEAIKISSSNSWCRSVTESYPRITNGWEVDDNQHQFGTMNVLAGGTGGYPVKSYLN